MKNLLYLTLVLLFVYIIISGCGGGSGTTQPALLTTPVPNNSGNKAYITFNIKWPENGITGNFIVSSGNKKEITASMPEGSLKFKAYVVDYTDKDPNALIDFNETTGLLASGIAEYPETQFALEIPLDSAIARHLTGSAYLPPFPVKIWAGAFGTSGDPNDPNTALISTEQYVELEVGPQLVTLPLGDYELTVEASKLMPNLSQGSEIITNIGPLPTPTPTYGTFATPTPTPGGTGGGSETFQITARLMIVYPTPAPNPSPEPDATVTPVSTPKPVEQKLINFEVIEGDDATLSSASGYTNVDGYCTTTLTTSTSGTKVIKASFIPDTNTPDIKYTDTCTVTAGTNTDIERYRLKLTANRYTIHSSMTSTIEATLIALLPDEEVPAEGKRIEFSVEPVSYEPGSGNLDSFAQVTDGNGKCKVCFTGIDTGKVNITARFTDTTVIPNATYTAVYSITVLGKYELSLTTAASAFQTGIHIVPDFQTTDNDNIHLSKSNFFTATLFKYSGDQGLIHAQGETITFSITEGPGKLSATTVNTDANGQASVLLDLKDYNGTMNTLTKVKAYLNDDYWCVGSELIVGSEYVDRFESYTSHVFPGYSDIPDWNNTSGDIAGGIDSIGANNTNQSLNLSRLIGYSGSSSFLGREIGTFGDTISPYNHLSREIRFYIRVQTDSALVSLGGITINNGRSFRLLNFQQNKIYDTNNEEIPDVSYAYDTWYPVRIQLLGSDNSLAKIKVNYWFDGKFRKEIYLENLAIYTTDTRKSCILGFSSNGNAWLDEIEHYKLQSFNLQSSRK